MKLSIAKQIIAVTLLTVFAATSQPVSSGASEISFEFNGTMSKEVLRNFASRAVTSWLVLENNAEDPIFDEDLRMHLSLGAKYLSRAATFSWGGNMTKAQVDDHFEQAEIIAGKVHAADPQIILQGGVFEIAYKGTVNSTEIPAFIFEAFGLPAEERNFRYEEVAFPIGHNYGPGFWGMGPDAAVPNIANIETQMYFYYNICRYIDAGFEAIHIGQAEMMMDYKDVTNAKEWDRVLTLSRSYAAQNARRGIVLFDAHSSLGSDGLMIGKNLILDIQSAPLFPSETIQKDGVLMCEAKHFTDDKFSYIGRTKGGTHPLGFEVDQNFTILEFDNFGRNDEPGVPTYEGFYSWGYDDITWFALQPEWYRNQFLTETDDFLRTDPRIQDKEGKQIYFIQPALKRVLSGEQKMTYIPGENYDPDFVVDYFEIEKTAFDFHEDPLRFELTVRKDYRANTQSDMCPNGSNQEDTIRAIFLSERISMDHAAAMKSSVWLYTISSVLVASVAVILTYLVLSKRKRKV